jgi:hypothetical protein
MRLLALLAVLSALLAGAPALAADITRVEVVTSPAWVVRNGVRGPMAPGQPLDTGATVVTGPEARVVLRLGDGSTVKLGENARFFVAEASRQEAGGVFQATLRVLTGAFRFTTAAVAKVTGKRDVTIRLPTVTAGIRGTDLWGKATDDREFIALIEGRIGVKRDGGEEVVLDRPLSLFDAPRGAPTPPVGTLEATLLARYAQETEVQKNSGALTGGRWKVEVLATADEREALAAYDRLREAGYPAIIDPRGRGAAVRYRVRIAGLEDSAEAGALALRLGKNLGFPGVSVTR